MAAMVAMVPCPSKPVWWATPGLSRWQVAQLLGASPLVGYRYMGLTIGDKLDSDVAFVTQRLRRAMSAHPHSCCLDGCRHQCSTCLPNLVEVWLSEAIVCGLTPCKRCCPSSWSVDGLKKRARRS